MKAHHVALLCLAALAQNTSARPAAELLFDWPRDLVARVNTERTRERHTNTVSSTTSRASYRLRVLPHQEGLTIKYDEFNVEGLPQADRAGMADVLTSMSPDTVVGPSGEFRRIEDIASMKAAVNRIFAPLLESGRVPPGGREFLKQFMTDEVLTGLAGQEWQLLVGAWIGLPLSTEPFNTTTEGASPIGNIPVRMNVTGRMLERSACSRGGVSRECAIFEMRSAPDPAALETVMKQAMATLDLKGVTYEQMDVVTVARIRLETQTMVPHELTTTKTVEMIVSVPQQGRTKARQVDRRTSTFAY